MLIECPYCRSRVDANVEGECKIPKSLEDYDQNDSKIAIGKCSSCGSVLVGLQDQHEHPEGGLYWADAERVWPSPRRSISNSIPEIVKSSLEEADKCFSAGAFTACAVMCGRAIEGVCVHHQTKAKTLDAGLKELLEKGVIDGRLQTWGDELRKLRNLGAHASGEKVLYQDAADVLTFAHAISDYVFVLTQQFQEFMERRPSKKAK